MATTTTSITPSQVKFEQFGVLNEEYSYEKPPKHVKNEKLKASVRWMNFSEDKWIFVVDTMEAQNVLKRSFENVKILLLHNTAENRKLVKLASENVKPWTYQTFQPLDTTEPQYNCFEEAATYDKTPFILCPSTPEKINSLALGLYDTEKTKQKRYRVKIAQLLLLDIETESVYNMNEVKFEGTYKHNDS